MDFTLNHSISQRQQNTLTPKMAEELKILQMSNLELQNYLDQQIIENPLLDLDDREDSGEEGELEWNLFNSYFQKGHNKQGNISDIKDFTEYTPTPITLREFLVTQLIETVIEKQLIKVVMYLIENVNDDGYLITSIRETAAVFKMSQEHIIKALSIIQTLEPAGVGARNLKECILVQLKRKNQMNDDIKNIVKNHLQLLAQRRYSEICSQTGLKKNRVIEIHSIIKTTDPKPGRRISYYHPEYIQPELTVQPVGQGFIVLFNYEWNIDLKLNNFYRKMFESKNESEDANKYIKSKLQKAIATVHAVELRKETIIKVATFIINYQGDFIKHGYKEMKPLTMKMVADNVGLHESTISRTVSGKYIQTPKGIFELKYFFSNQVESDQKKKSSLYIKKSIKNIVDNEDKSNPLSDDKIKQLLESNGMKVARRTIAKYREGLKILPANIRRLE